MRKNLYGIAWLEEELALAKDHVAGVEAQFQKKKKKLSSKKATNATLKKKLDEALDWANKVEKRAEVVEANALQVVANYKKLIAFEDEVTETSVITYHCEFGDCKEMVTQLFLDQI